MSAILAVSATSGVLPGYARAALAPRRPRAWASAPPGAMPERSELTSRIVNGRKPDTAELPVPLVGVSTE
jgi:hypothetical protein